MLELKYQKTKTVICKDNGRSADATSGNMILGCRDKHNNPFCSYCYVHRFGRKFVYVNTNVDEILNECNKWVSDKPLIKTPNQVHDNLYLVDISCDTDINKNWNLVNWFYIFDYFKNHPRLGATFATKWVNTKLLNYEPEGKIRVRMSLMSENTKSILEKGTSPIINRIKFLNKLQEHGFSTHINFSPIVYYSNWLENYKELFDIINNETSDDFKKQAACECIFLTHNEYLHNINLQRGLIEAEQLLWQPTIQETKISQYGGDNLRYKWQFKNELINKFKKVHNEIIPWCDIRYIF